ncbi:porin [Vibrio rotiferianus]|uniref:porin n=1 Tax=Vibrio rotiferianus TaxID=190895 RepID=UPI00406A28AD
MKIKYSNIIPLYLMFSPFTLAEDNNQTNVPMIPSEITSIEGDLSDLSSTAPLPNNYYTLLDEDVVRGSAYASARLGGDLLINSDIGDVAWWNIFKMGADFEFLLSDYFSFLIGGEARYGWGGVDAIDGAAFGNSNTDVDRFQFGIRSDLGLSTYGKQCGTVDAYIGFGDIAKEHGLEAEMDEIACKESLWNHMYAQDNFDIGGSYDSKTNSWGLGGSFTLGEFIIGGAYADIRKTNSYDESGITDYDGNDKRAGTVGVIWRANQITTAVKYSIAKHQANSSTKDSCHTDGYALGLAYDLTQNLNIATTYNEVNTSQSTCQSPDNDNWFTAGLAYHLNKNIEFVTEYKGGTNDGDKLFFRTNVNF